MAEKAEKKRYSFKDYAPQVLKIEQATENIATAVAEMPPCSAKTSFILSVKNLQKKIAKISSGKTLMTDEEKDLLRKFRAGEIIISPKTQEQSTPIEDKTDAVSPLPSNMGATSKGKPKGKKH